MRSKFFVFILTFLYFISSWKFILRINIVNNFSSGERNFEELWPDYDFLPASLVEEEDEKSDISVENSEKKQETVEDEYS